MSLSVHLTSETREVDCKCFCGNRHTRMETEEYYSRNITHNLAAMAKEAGLYRELWQPEEMGITKASQLIEPLGTGLVLLWSNPARFQAFDSASGWGNYDNLVIFVENYLDACLTYPDSAINVSR